MSGSLESERNVRINRKSVLCFKLSHSRFCTKALQIMSQKRVLKRNSLVTGKRKRKTKRNGKNREKHVESARVARRLMTSHGLRGLVRKEKIVQEEAMRSDMWSYLDDDFHVEISDELYHHCLALVCDKGNADTEKFA